VEFSELVTIDPGAFELRALHGGSIVDLNSTLQVVDGRTVATLTFTGFGVLAGSLADGRYLLTVYGDRVHSMSGAALEDDMIASIFRFFGDSDGDADVDVNDARSFVRALSSRVGQSGYLGWLDADDDGDIDRTDLREFVRRIGRRLTS